MTRVQQCRMPLYAALAAMMLVGCSTEALTEDGQASTPGRAAQASETTVEGGTLRVGARMDPDGLDPHLGSNPASSLWVGAMFDTLVGQDTGGLPAPGLAEDWEVSADGLTYTFSLRSGVTFHNGRDLTAEDVAFNLDRIREPENGATNAANLATIESVSAPDDRTVVVELDSPNAALPSELAFPGRLAIVAPESFENGSIAEPIGTGPFSYVDYQRDDHLELATYDDYWRDVPTIDGLSISIIGDALARLTAVSEGQVDFAYGVPPAQGEIFEKSGQIDLQSVRVDNASWLGINSQRSPFDDPNLRGAMMSAIDRNDIVAGAYSGYAECAVQPFFEDSFWNVDFEGAPGCDAASKQPAQVLESAGYSSGEVSATITAVDFFDTQKQEAEIIASAWEEMGISTSVEVVDIATFLERGSTGNFDVVSSPIGVIYDPHRPYTYFDPASPLNPFTGPVDLSDLVKEGRISNDPEERRVVYRDLLSQVYAQDSFAYTVNVLDFLALSQRVTGYEQAAVRGVLWAGDGDLTSLQLTK